MKKQFLTLVFTLLSWAGYAQNSFNEVVFNEMMQGWARDPVGTLKSGADPNFTFINGNGQVISLAQLIDSYTNGFTESNRQIEQLNVRQSGSTGIATGILRHTFHFKNNASASFTYKGLFTYTFSQQKGKWLLASAQHTDFRDTKEADETAIKKVIENLTAIAYLNDVPAYLKMLAPSDFISRVSVEADGKVNKLTGAEYRKMVNDRVSYGPQKMTTQVTRDNFNLRINGNSAFAVFDQHNVNADGTKRDSVEERYLEKINGEWKIVNVTVIPKK